MEPRATRREGPDECPGGVSGVACRVQTVCGALKAKFGASASEPGVVCAETEEQISHLLRFFFSEGSKLGTTATFDNCTCCVVRPHAVKDGHVGKIIEKITAQVRETWGRGPALRKGSPVAEEKEVLLPRS